MLSGRVSMARHPWIHFQTCACALSKLCVAVVLLNAVQAHSHAARSGNREHNTLTSSYEILPTVQGSAVLRDWQADDRSDGSRFQDKSRFVRAGQNPSAETDDEELQILLQFKSRLTNGEDLLAGWQSTSENVCEWMGVSCDHRRNRVRVTELKLPSLGLNGQISPALGRLRFLLVLDLSNNFLYGDLPQSLGNLSYLHFMSFSSNNITGHIPPELGRLAALRSLYLGNNGLSGGIPLSISNCSSLTALDFSLNFLEGSIPPELGLLTRLEKLSLAGNTLTGPIPPSVMANCTSLKLLLLASNKLNKGVIPGEVGRLFLLEELNLSFNYLTGRIPVTLTNCSNLFYLDLNQNNLEGSIPWEFGHLIKLKFLNLKNNLLTSSIPSSLANFSRMESFHTGRNNGPGPTLPDPFPDWIGSWQNLKLLEMPFSGLIGTLPSSLFNCTKLKGLSIYSNNMGGLIPPEIGNLSRLSGLDMSDNQLNGEIPDSLVALRNLQYVILSTNDFKGYFPLFSRNFNSSVLKWILLESNSFQGTLPSDLETRIPNLTELKITSNSFRGNLPSSLGSLSGLMTLRAGYNLFQGPIPSSIGNLSYLGVLSLNWNKFYGSVPTEILVGCSQLFILNLSSNALEGALVEEISMLSQLNTIDISHNRFSGPIPSSLGSMVTLISIDMSFNSFSGKLPARFLPPGVSRASFSYNKLQGTLSGLGDLQEIEFLDGAFNLLSGSISEDIGECRNMQKLDLSSNNLSGVIPTSLGQLIHLKELNLSNNNLEGPIPATGVFSTLNFTKASFAGNPRLCGDVVGIECPVVAQSKSGSIEDTRCKSFVCKRAILMSSILGTCFVVFMLGLWIFWLSRKSSTPIRSPNLNVSEYLPQFSAKILVEATNGFSEDSVVGQGNSAKVYKAIFGDGSILAAKVFQSFLMQAGGEPCHEAVAKKQFLREAGSLGKLRHRNVLKIVGYCFDGNVKALLLEFMPEGSLHDHLYEKMSILSLDLRLDIIEAITNGLIYLHDEFPDPIIHRDLNPANILLDTSMVPKISDFACAKFVYNHVSSESGYGESSSTLTVNGGTIGYIPPEYSSSRRVSTRGDVYAFGIIVMELVTRRKAIQEDEHLVDWVSNTYSNGDDLKKIADGSMVDELDDSNKLRIVELLMKVAILCCRPIPGDRPQMKEVKEMLYYIRELGREACVYASVSELVHVSDDA